MPTLAEEDPKRAILNALARLRLHSKGSIALLGDGHDRGVVEALDEAIEEEAEIITRSLDALTIVCA